MFQAGLPYLVLTGGLLVVMIGVAIKRTHAVAAVLTIVTLIATTLSHIVAYSALGDGAVEITPMFKVDGIAYLFNILFLLAALVVAFFGSEFLSRRVRFKEEFYLLLLCATLGSLVLPAAVHFASLILGLEIVGISLYAMIAYPEKSSSSAGSRFEIFGALWCRIDSATVRDGDDLCRFWFNGVCEFATVRRKHRGAIFLLDW